MRKNSIKLGLFIGGFLLLISNSPEQVFGANSGVKVTQTSKKAKKSNRNQKAQEAWKKRVKAVQHNVKTLKSGKILTNLKIGLQTNENGINKQMYRIVKGTMLIQQNPMKIKNDIVLQPFLSLPAQKNQSYMEEKDNKIYQYIKLGEQWETIAVEKTGQQDLFEVGAFSNATTFFEGMSDIKVIGKGTIAGQKVTKVQGTLSKVGLKALLDTAGVLAVLNLDQGISLNKSSIEKYYNHEKLTFWVTKENELVKLKSDLTSPVKKMMNDLDENSLKSASYFPVTQSEITISYQNRNQPVEITIPQEVYDAKKIEMPGK